MADSWTIISTVAGVVGMLAAIVTIFNWDKIAYYFQRPQYSPRLVWGDIVDGELHQKGPEPLCSGPHLVPNRLPCAHERPHASGQNKCWEGNLTVLFNASWSNDPNLARQAKKPQLLNGSHEYIQTDPKVLLAYLLCTCTMNSGFHGRLDKHDRADKIPVFHISGGLQIKRILTKIEARCLIEGYPPWYREYFRSVYGDHLPHPLRPYSDLDGPDSDGLRRAGWILALGFQEPLSLDGWGAIHESAPFHLTTRGWSPPALVQRADRPYHPYHSQHPLHTSVSRMITVIEEILVKAFPHNQSVKTILTSMKEMDRLGYTGAVIEIPGIRMRRWSESRENGGAGRLNRADTIWAISFFNELSPIRPLREHDKRRVEPMLDAVMIAAFYGISSVIMYEKLHNPVFHEANELRDIRGSIWLQDCAEQGSM